MCFTAKENERFRAFVRFVESHTKSKFQMVFDVDYKGLFKAGTLVEGTYGGGCDSDNCLDEDDPNYEEYYMIMFDIINPKCLIEVNYHHVPIEFWCDGVKVDF